MAGEVSFVISCHICREGHCGRALHLLKNTPASKAKLVSPIGSATIAGAILCAVRLVSTSG